MYQFWTGRTEPRRLEEDWSGLFQNVQRLLSRTQSSLSSVSKVSSHLSSNFVTLSSSSRNNETAGDSVVVVVASVAHNLTNVESKLAKLLDQSSAPDKRKTTVPRRRKKKRRKKLKKSKIFPLWLFAKICWIMLHHAASNRTQRCCGLFRFWWSFKLVTSTLKTNHYGIRS